MVIVAQLVRASDCGSEGRGFESRLSPSAAIAQSVERILGKDEVTSSILVGSFNALVAQLDRASHYGCGGWGFKSLRGHVVHVVNHNKGDI